MSTCEPDWRPASPSNCGNLPAHSLLPVLAKARSPPRRATSIYQRMTNCPPEVPRSHAVHHPRTSWKPNLERGHLVDPTGPSASQGAEYGRNLVEASVSQHQLINMCPIGLGASPYQYHPCTRLSRPPSHRK